MPRGECPLTASDRGTAETAVPAGIKLFALPALVRVRGFGPGRLWFFHILAD